MTNKFTGKVAVVTGASKGIGAAIALRLAEEGASVIVNYSASKESAKRVVAEISKKNGKALAIHANLNNESDIRRLFAETKKAFGPIDVLINNAGIYEFSPLQDVTAEHFHKQFNLNVLALILATKEAVNYFNDKGGSIVNLSSAASSLTPPDTVVYSATKGAVDAITKVLSKELASKKIRVNSVNPGMIETEGVIAASLNEGDFRTWLESNTPLARIGKVEEVAQAVSFLASDEASYISGENLFISGGLK
jgi:3-oxoacyl-[acyl-carrier protein] reductase